VTKGFYFRRLLLVRFFFSFSERLAGVSCKGDARLGVRQWLFARAIVLIQLLAPQPPLPPLGRRNSRDASDSPPFFFRAIVGLSRF